MAEQGAAVATPAETDKTAKTAKTAEDTAARAISDHTLGEVKIDLPQSVPTRTTASRPRREIEPLATDRFGVRFTADAELRELIDRARALASHRLANGDLASLIKLMARSFVQHEEKRRFGIGARSRKAAKRSSVAAEPTPPGGAPEQRATSDADEPGTSTCSGEQPSTTRYVPTAARRDVHERDGGRCAFVSATGRRCNASAHLEIDHLTPFAFQGASTVRNLRLLCRAHNRLHARRCFGELHIAAKIAARRRGEAFAS